MNRNRFTIALACASCILLLAGQTFAAPLDELLGSALKAAAQEMKGGGSQQKADVPPTAADSGSRTTQNTAGPVVKYDEATIKDGWSCITADSKFHDKFGDVQRQSSESLLRDLASDLKLFPGMEFPGCKLSRNDAAKFQRMFLDEYCRFDVLIVSGDLRISNVALQNATLDAVLTFHNKYKNRLERDYSMTIKINSSAFERERSVRLDLARQQKKQDIAEQQKRTDALEADLRAGKVKPINLRQAAIAFGAEDGTNLAGAPKIRPDGKMYAMHGIIEKAGNNPDFIAHFSAGRAADISEMLKRENTNEILTAVEREKGFSTNYFKVTIPKAMQAAYFDNAKIGGGFDLVGRYVENVSYKTVAGQQKSAPVFEAVYLVIWK